MNTQGKYFSGHSLTLTWSFVISIGYVIFKRRRYITFFFLVYNVEKLNICLALTPWKCVWNISANKETQLLEKERKSRIQYEKLMEEKQRKLKEQKEKDEQRRISAEEKRKQKLQEERVCIFVKPVNQMTHCVAQHRTTFFLAFLPLLPPPLPKEPSPVLAASLQW